MKEDIFSRDLVLHYSVFAIICEILVRETTCIYICKAVLCADFSISLWFKNSLHLSDFVQHGAQERTAVSPSFPFDKTKLLKVALSADKLLQVFRKALKRNSF